MELKSSSAGTKKFQTGTFFLELVCTTTSARYNSREAQPLPVAIELLSMICLTMIRPSLALLPTLASASPQIVTLEICEIEDYSE